MYYIVSSSFILFSAKILPPGNTRFQVIKFLGVTE